MWRFKKVSNHYWREDDETSPAKLLQLFQSLETDLDVVKLEDWYKLTCPMIKSKAGTSPVLDMLASLSLMAL